MTADAIGGVWTYALDVAGGLAEHGVLTTLAVLGPAPSREAADMAGGVRGLRLLETGLPLDWTAENETSVAAAARRLSALARESGAEVIHLNSPALAAHARFAAPVLGVCHSDVASWWAAVRGGPLPDDFRWRSALLLRGYAACDALVAPTAAFAVETQRLYGVLPAVVHNGRAPARPSATPRDRLVLTSGRLWDEGKNVATLDAAAEQIDAPVVALGSLEGPSGQAGTLKAIQAFGSVSGAEVAGHLARAPVFCSLALYEPFGLGVLEAAQAGCALVLSDIPTFRELWDGAAVFVDSRDVDGAAAALQGLLDDRERASSLGAAAAERAQAYSAQAMVTGVVDAYAGLLAARVPAEAAA